MEDNYFSHKNIQERNNTFDRFSGSLNTLGKIANENVSREHIDICVVVTIIGSYIVGIGIFVIEIVSAFL